MVLTFTSATSKPVTTMKAQQRMQATAEARKPDSCVTAGIASIPAPTVVPATKKIALDKLPENF
jgi:hypothetical protein